MPDSFPEKLKLILKSLSLSRVQLASDLAVDKSVIGRWVSGAVKPSDHNLQRLTALIAERLPGFSSLDWDRSAAEFAAMLGAVPVAPLALPLPLLDMIKDASSLRGAAYAGFFRTTRPYNMQPDRFVHDHGMLRMGPDGLLALRMGTAGTRVEGWMLTLHNELFCIAADVTSGALLFGIFHGVATARAQRLDGIALAPSLDPGRTPTAYAMVFDRIGDLSGDIAADNAEFERLAALNPLAPEGSVPEALRAHLLRDIGPAAHALGGDMLLRMPLARSLARGLAYEDVPRS